MEREVVMLVPPRRWMHDRWPKEHLAKGRDGVLGKGIDRLKTSTLENPLARRDASLWQQPGTPQPSLLIRHRELRYHPTLPSRQPPAGGRRKAPCDSRRSSQSGTIVRDTVP